MLEVVLGVVAFLGLIVAVVWLWSRPGEPDEEQTARLIAGNWPRIKDRLDHNGD